MASSFFLRGLYISYNEKESEYYEKKNVVYFYGDYYSALWG